jgi:hypothetical protein
MRWVAPVSVLAGQVLDQRGDRLVERWAAGAVRVGPLLGHQAVVPAQERGRGDQVMSAQHRGEASDERGEQGSVGPVQARPRVGSAEDGDLVAKDEQLHILRRRFPAQQHEPAEEPIEDQVDEMQRHVMTMPGRRRMPITDRLSPS